MESMIDRIAPELTGTRATAVAAELRRLIQSGELPPGTRLRQAEIAERYGMSTTPVREAFTTLAREGFIRHDTHRGAVVFVPSIEDVHENYEIRIVLEPLATGFAADRLQPEDLDELDSIVERQREFTFPTGGTSDVPIEWVILDGDFHRLICSAAARPRLAEMINTLRDIADGYPQVADARRAGGFIEHAQADHVEIAKALRDRDGARASQLAGDHLRFALSRLG